MMNEIDFAKMACEVLDWPHVCGSVGWDWEHHVIEVARREFSPTILLGRRSRRRPAPSPAAPPDRFTIGQELSPSSKLPLIEATTTATDGALSGSEAALENRFTYGRTLIQIRYCADNGAIEIGEFSTVRDKGMFYLYVIIHNPHKAIRAAELETHWGQWNSERRRSQEAPNDGFVNRSTYDPTIDSRALAEIKAEIRDLKEEIEEAKELNEVDRVIQLEEEVEPLLARLRSDFFGKRAKNADPAEEKLRNRVSKALANGWSRILDQMPGFAGHLKRATVKQTGAWEYRPTGSSGTWLR
jgi:hypothetical protein